ncbi:hypothetical protein EV421DRAFT_2020771 [Armillaria borealis]|uniref:Uncharacterized protein n=1 Tax=Armillaria borealis TaxID=47425 RepID=A0AA39JFH8_9AGAR|nr:hypothetical protein EV421DRAFT_2020771 [Armillaria borealis]
MLSSESTSSCTNNDESSLTVWRFHESFNYLGQCPDSPRRRGLCYKNPSRTIDFALGLSGQRVKTYKGAVNSLRRNSEGVKTRLLLLPEDKQEAYSRLRKITRITARCGDWFRDLVSQRADGLVSVQDEREAAIYQKLLALGYGPGIEKQNSWRDDRFHGDLRAKRLSRKRKQLVYSRKVTVVNVLWAYKNSPAGLPDATIFSSFPDFYDFTPVMKSILELPSEVVADTANFDSRGVKRTGALAGMKRTSSLSRDSGKPSLGTVYVQRKQGIETPFDSIIGAEYAMPTGMSPYTDGAS